MVPLKTQRQEMIQQVGELHKPGGEAEGRRTGGKLCFEAGPGWQGWGEGGARPHQEELESHADPMGFQLTGKEPHIWGLCALPCPFA